jgi:hypothetical protein
MLVTKITTVYSEKHINILFGQNREGFLNEVLMSQQVVSKEEASLQEKKGSSYGMRWGEAGLLLFSDTCSTHEKVL